jgi:hypothetical protein
MSSSFREGWVRAEGVIYFTGMTFEGVRKNHSVKFSVLVSLKDEFLVGAPIPPTFQYNAELRLSGQDYVVDVPISHYLKPGEVDRFNIRVGVLQSSRHTFRLRLSYNNDQSVLSEPIQLDVLLPQGMARLLRSGPTTQININGIWRDPTRGTMSQITQQGETFRFTAWGPSCIGGTFQSSGSGTIKGNLVESRYQSLIQPTLRSEGHCSGTVSTDGMQMTSTCNDSVCGQFTSSVVRQ